LDGITPIAGRMMEWISMRDNPPTEAGEVLFIPKDGLTDERLGIALPHEKYVLLKRTDVAFKDIDWWMPVPKTPEN
jgi:hypothetical protein